MRPKTGFTITETKVFTQADFDEFARLSGDDNPIHVDPAFSARTKFGRTVAHGMFLYGTICGVLSAHFPGAVQVEQHLMFPAPTFTGEVMTIVVEVTAVNAEDGQIRCKTTITNPNGQLTCDGETVLAWDAEGRG
jgi:acyl dehydratase